MPAEIDVGKVVAGKYELVRLIGKGAMGEVWLTTHSTLGGEFAIKLVKPSDDEDDESAAGRFQLEAQVSAKLSRKTRHIISVSDHGEEDGLAYLVMELLEGESLEARIKHGGALPLPETIGIVMQIARALGQAHAEGIFHRDLKPANIFLTKDEDGRLLVKLLDFGIARSKKPFNTRSPFATAKDMVLGTPSYMSPEQARGLDSLDHRCDLWALAVVAYESLTRKIPWEGDTVEDIFLSICTHRMIPVHARRPDLPPEVSALFERAFTPSLSGRFGEAAALSQAFEALADPMAVETAMWPPGRMPSPSSPRLRNISEPEIQGPAPIGQRYGEPISDSTDLTIGGTTDAIPRRRSTGWVVAVVAAVATIGIVIFIVSTFSSHAKATSTAPPIVTTAAPPSTGERNTVPPPPEPTTRIAPLAVTPAQTPASPQPAPKPTGKTHAVAQAPAPPPATAPVATVAPPPATPPVVAPPPTPAPAPKPPHPPEPAPARKPLDKGEVF